MTSKTVFILVGILVVVVCIFVCWCCYKFNQRYKIQISKHLPPMFQMNRRVNSKHSSPRLTPTPTVSTKSQSHNIQINNNSNNKNVKENGNKHHYLNIYQTYTPSAPNL